MAPKKNAAAAPGSAAAEVPSAAQAKSNKAAAKAASSSPPAQLTQVGNRVWSHYLKTTGHQIRLIDAFLAFLMAVGAIQFVYYILVAKDVRNQVPLPFSLPFSLQTYPSLPLPAGLRNEAGQG